MRAIVGPADATAQRAPLSGVGDAATHLAVLVLKAAAAAMQGQESATVQNLHHYFRPFFTRLTLMPDGCRP